MCVSNRVNANLDLIVSAIPLLETLGLLPGQPVDHTHLGTVEDLQEQVAYSMEHCAGTERVFSSQSEFERVVTAAYQLPHSVSLVCVCVCVCVSEYCTCCEKKNCLLYAALHRRKCSSHGSQDTTHTTTHTGSTNTVYIANKTFTKVTFLIQYIYSWCDFLKWHRVFMFMILSP